MILEIRDLGFGYRNHTVLTGVNLTVRDGEMVSLLGKNGAGKTTLLRIIAGFLKHYEGSIRIDGRSADAIGIRERASLMAYIPQISSSAFPYSVRTSILMGASNRLSVFQSPGKKEQQRVDEVIELLNLHSIADRNMENISGGERQLVLIARAIMQDARLLILDEPTSFLDYSNQLLVLERVEELVQRGYCCIYSTHNPDLAMMHCCRVAAMSEGKLIYDAAPDDLIGSDLLSALYGRKIDIVRTAGGSIVCIPD